MFEEYTDDISKIEIFPEGKIFRLSFDANVREFRLFCKHYEMLEELREAYSAPNKAQFFVKQYGYRAESKVYVINKFGYFMPGLIFEILSWIKNNFGDLSVLVVS